MPEPEGSRPYQILRIMEDESLVRLAVVTAANGDQALRRFLADKEGPARIGDFIVVNLTALQKRTVAERTQTKLEFS